MIAVSNYPPPLPPKLYLVAIISHSISTCVSIYYQRAVLIVPMIRSPRSLGSTCFGVILGELGPSCTWRMQVWVTLPLLINHRVPLPLQPAAAPREGGCTWEP